MAAYAERQANHHRSEEHFNRQAQLTLASIGPFIHKLPKEKQDEILFTLANRLFTEYAFDNKANEGDMLELPKKVVLKWLESIVKPK
ncbi:MAG: hypothetical protein FJY67_11880 [Calditrichaeota bacterium]|nr:hypothetical protein [Calditrichota bacterium]